MTLGEKQSKRYKDELFLKKLGERMQELMDQKKITHEVFYNDTGVNPHRIKVGKHNITVLTLKRICEYLEISVSSFFEQM